jgi:hypothetical protein
MVIDSKLVGRKMKDVPGTVKTIQESNITGYVKIVTNEGCELVYLSKQMFFDNLEPTYDYTILVNLYPFFKAGDRANLNGLRKVFSMEALALLIKDDYIKRDCNVITAGEKKKEIIKASDDLIDWVEVEYIETVGSKFKCKIISNGYVATFKYVK